MPGHFNFVISKEYPTVIETFCGCCDKEPGRFLSCSCGEEREVYEWSWDPATAGSPTYLEKDNREVHFYPVYSTGTSAVRGNKPLVAGYDYYWEIKLFTHLFGTDVVIGVGTSKANLASTHDFCSLVGADEESYGYSYLGKIHHGGRNRLYGGMYGRSSIVGVHLDMRKGTLEFYLNRRPLGVAFTGLQGKTLYPMMSSTTAKSVMKLTYAFSEPSTLQLLCLQSLRGNPEMVEQLRTVPYLRSYVDKYYWWLLPSKK